MRYIELPTFDNRISRIALGVNKTGNKTSSTLEEESRRVSFYHEAINLGINFFDTAELYGGGYSEEVLGKALQGSYRHDNIICTKFNAKNSSKEKIEVSLEGSLRRLNTEYVDLYLAHWPNPNVPFDDLLESLQKFKKQGKIRSFGLSNATFSEIEKFYLLNDNQPCVIENEYNIIDRSVEEGILPFAKRSGCLFLSYSPLAQGTAVTKNAQIDMLCNKYRCTIQQLFLAWIHDRDIVSIVRTMNNKHLQDNVSSLAIKLQTNEKQLLQDTFSLKKIKVNIESINLDKSPYVSVQDAIENFEDLIPSPLLLSDRLGKGYNFSPLRLVKNGDRYDILNGFSMSEIKKIWAWKILRPSDSKMEAYIYNDL
tara:strand:- start:5192 stop:6295 length:1104 start_codon:yes stop_codon:yes gene_type:complete